MRRIGPLLSVGLAVLMVASCSHSKKAEHSAPHGVDVAACTARGGEVRPVCLTGALACVTPFSDAGKKCRDSSECLGKCLVDEHQLNPVPEPGSAAEGRCQRDDDPCGCFVEVIDGIVQQGLCVD